MFELFTFGAQPQTRLLDEAFPSPTDTSLRSVLPPASFPIQSHSNQSDINDIVAKLQHQSLQQRSRDELAKRLQKWQTAESMTLVVDEEESEQGSRSSSAQSSPTCISTSCRRLQRQLNVQLQSCETHIKDINALVEDMISSNSQCRITNRSRVSTSLPIPRPREKLDVDPFHHYEGTIQDDVDEGFCEGEIDPEEELEMSLRMASAPTKVMKHQDWYGGRDVINVGGRIKVRSIPRMRKRKVQVSRNG